VPLRLVQPTSAPNDSGTTPAQTSGSDSDPDCDEEPEDGRRNSLRLGYQSLTPVHATSGGEKIKAAPGTIAIAGGGAVGIGESFVTFVGNLY